MSILSVVKVRIEPEKAGEILSEAATVLQGESTMYAGFVAGDILISHDKKTIVILTEWTDLHAWGQSRYDMRVGKMLESCVAASSEVEFEVYDRHARFSVSKSADVVKNAPS